MTGMSNVSKLAGEPSGQANAYCQVMPTLRPATSIWSWRVAGRIIKSKFMMARR